jgi:hypothetical protein
VNEGAAGERERTNQAAAALQEAAESTGRDVKQATQRAARDIQRHVAAAASEANAQASEAAQRAKANAAAYAARQKEAAAEEVEHIGEALKRAAGKLHEENDHNIAHYVDVAADGTDSIARYLRDRDYPALLRDARTIIRRHPATAFAGLFATGLAISRFLKASEPATESDRERRWEDPDRFAGISPAASTASHGFSWQ